MTFGSVSAFLARRAQVPLLIIPTHAGDGPDRGNDHARQRRLPLQEPADQGAAPDLDRVLHLLLRLVQHGAAGISMLRAADWLTRDDIRLFAIANVALTIPARIIVGMALDRYGPRRVFSVLMV
jgi:N-acyl-D-aspartate/D-glutamate deacylase